ncbi:M48 family metallopeptidase [Niabella insulamsoli]|uniref:M48 family metallopeptidase n=1 Tax=Niabella insulamsoli TaxID=3144874 RepID=UPI0031FBD9B7
MKKMALSLLAMAMLLGTANAQLKINKKAIGSVSKGVKAVAYSDADAARDAAAAVKWMDDHNPVAPANDPYTVRLNKIFGKHQSEDGLKLNYKVYKVVDINAFACADGSVRVFSSLMDLMSDDELLAVIGHEIGHVKNHDSKDAMKAALTRSAVADAAGSQSGVAAALTESQLGALAEAIMDSKHSRKQETDADSYSYDFMKKHGYNVMGAYNAFMTLASLSGNSGAQASKFQKMLSSHPDSKQRAEEVKQKAQKDGLWKEADIKKL